MLTRTKEGIVAVLEQTAVVWKTAIGSAIVWEMARLTGSAHPYLAPLTFILCLQATVGQSLRYALYRSLGTVIGVVMIGFFAKSIPMTAWALALALLLSTALLKVLRANDLLIHQVALSILFVLYFENHSSGYAWDRAKDTLIGAVVGVLFVLFLFPPNSVRKTEQTLRTVVQQFVDAVNLVATRLQQGQLHTSRQPQEPLNALLDGVDELTEALKNVKQGSPFNVYAKKTQVERVTQQCHRVRDACSHFVALTGSLTEEMTLSDRDLWSHRIRSLASEIPAFVYEASAAGDERKQTVPSTQQHAAFRPGVAEHELKAMVDALRGVLGRAKT